SRGDPVQFGVGQAEVAAAVGAQVHGARGREWRQDDGAAGDCGVDRHVVGREEDYGAGRDRLVDGEHVAGAVDGEADAAAGGDAYHAVHSTNREAARVGEAEGGTGTRAAGEGSDRAGHGVQCHAAAGLCRQVGDDEGPDPTLGDVAAGDQVERV